MERLTLDLCADVQPCSDDHERRILAAVKTLCDCLYETGQPIVITSDGRTYRVRSVPHITARLRPATAREQARIAAYRTRQRAVGGSASGRTQALTREGAV